jgi:tRNA pseudouridine38-40 synthase
MPEQRMKIALAYCGTPWRGWQSQAEGGTVQDEIESAIKRLIKLPLRIQGASRTDAGVHALGQVAHVDIPESVSLPHAAWKDGLNALLPETIRVLDMDIAPPDFDACGSVTEKVYRYRIWRAREMDPFEADRAWHVFGPLDMESLRQAAARLVGTHNFVRLSANRGDQSEEARRADVPGSTRTLHRVDLREVGDVLEIEIEGNAFLYRMVRMAVGSLIQVARGRDSLAWFTGLLESPHGLQTHQTAPAGGLYLVRVSHK